MRRCLISLTGLLLAGVAGAADPAASAATPKPRVRLDPTAYAAVSDPPVSATRTGAPSALMMDRFVVKDRYLLQTPRRAVVEPKGKFSLLKGGRMLGSDRFELGLWPSIDIMEKYNSFNPPKLTANFDVLRIKW